jgi:hypothetical protein
MLERKLLSAASQLAISARCLVGPDMIEGGMCNPDAMAGTNGLIFLICHDTTSTELTKRRLHEVVKAKHHYGGIPVAFLMTHYMDSEKMKVDLDIETLMHGTGIRICRIFHRKPKCKSGLEDMVSKVHTVKPLFLNCWGIGIYFTKSRFSSNGGFQLLWSYCRDMKKSSLNLGFH